MNRGFLVGSPYWCRYLQRQLSSDSYPHFTALNPRRLRDVLLLLSHSNSVLVIVGLGSRPSIKRLIIWALAVLFVIRGRGRNRLSCYWIGSDVWSLDGNVAARFYVTASQWMGVTHICGAPWFVEELKRHRVNAIPVLFPYDTELAEQFACAELEDLPLRVCTYLTRHGWHNLHGDTIMQVAALTPDVHWTVIGMSRGEIVGSSQAPSNVNFLGWLEEPLRAQADSHVFVRLARHDAFSGTVRDAIALNRIVLYSLPVAGAIHVNAAVEDLVELIKTIATASSRTAFLPASQNAGFSAPPFRAQIDQLRSALTQP